MLLSMVTQLPVSWTMATDGLDFCTCFSGCALQLAYSVRSAWPTSLRVMRTSK